MISICPPRHEFIPRGQRRNQCLFWQANFCRPLDMGPLSIPRSPEFFHSFRGTEGDLLRDALKKSPLTPLLQRGENYLRISSKSSDILYVKVKI